MKIHIILLYTLCVFPMVVYSQSIRKDYREMTQSEKDALVNAFYQLRSGADLIDDIATFHNNQFNDIHFNLPSRPQLDVFLAWHRRQMFELEQAMQDINPRLSIPYWDWTTDNSVNSDLWDQDFLGQFDNDWNLNRTLGSFGALPTTSDVNSVQSISNWLNYSNTFERGVVHAGPHNWVGGIMAGGASPRDPVFYFHHGMVDKLWQEWVVANGITPASNIYQINDMPRYDGTYSFNGQTLPSVNPDNIVNAKVFGVFFAENGLAEMEDYTVNNTYNSTEHFYYQYTIEAGNNFIVPPSKSAVIESVNEVILEHGFHAQNGSSFLAKIDADNNINTQALQRVDLALKQKPFSKLDIVENAYGMSENGSKPLDNFTNSIKAFSAHSVEVFPNPAKNHLNIRLEETCSDCRIEIYNVHGQLLLFPSVSNSAVFKLDLSTLNSGMYYLMIRESGRTPIVHKIVKQ